MKKVTIISMLLILLTSAPFAFGQKVIQIAAGTDQIAAAYAQADSGDIIELITSGGTYLETANLKIKKALTIRAADDLAEKPIIETESVDRPFEPTGACTYFGLFGVKISGLVDDGVVDSKDSTKYAMRVRSMSGPYSLVCEDVDFDHFYSTDNPPEGYVVRFDNSAVLANEIRFTNCTFTRITKHVLRLDGPTAAPGQFEKLKLENCTFADIGGRGVYATLLNDPLVTPAEIFVNHCTFTGIADDALKINNGVDVVVKNSIFNMISDQIVDADSAEVYTSATVSYCDTLQTDGFSRFLTLTSSNIYAEDPEFVDAANFDFTVSDFFKGIAKGDDGFVVGDLRWDAANPVRNGKIQLEAGVDKITSAYPYAAAYGIDVIELITSGGTYLEKANLKIKIPLTIKASEGLAEKPIIETESVDRPFEPTGACTYFGLFGVKISGLVDDGVVDSKDSTKYAMRVRSMSGPYSLICEDVDFDHFYSTDNPPEGYVVRFDNSAVLANEIRFTNCTFTRIGKHVLRLDGPTAAPGQFEKLKLENCTFADIGGRGVYATLLNDPLVTPAEIFVNHCTFAGIADDALKINNGVDAVIKNSIFYNISDQIVDADSAEVYTSATVSYCDTLQTDGFSRFLNLTSSNIYAEDPEFVDAANFDFTVSDFFKSIAIGDDGLVVGDLRWDKDNPVVGTVVQIPEGTDQILKAYNYAKFYGINTIELITSGGTYLEKANLKIKIPLTIKASEGLAEKPIIETESVDRPFEPTGACTYFGLFGVKISGLVDDGVVDSKDSTKYAMRVRSMSGPYSLVCEDVDFDHFYSTDDPPEGYVVRFDNSAVLANEIRFTNCTFTRITKHVLRLDGPTAAPGQFEKLKLENCTFADIGGRGVYATLLNDPLVTPAEIFVNHCTFYGIQDDALKINNGVDAIVKNSIFYKINDQIFDADSAEVYTSASVSFCDTMLTDGFSKYLTLVTSNIYAEDPEFNDPANFDFHISSFFASIAIGDDGTVIGDPRWSVPTGVKVTEANLPTKFNLNQNYPNPFNPTTMISYALPKDAQVKLVVFNVLGQKVKTLIDQKQQAGYKVVHWDGRDENGVAVVSGVYLFRIEAGEFTATKKMLMLK